VTLDEVEAKRLALKFTEVARMLVDGSPAGWVPRILLHYSPLIGYHQSPSRYHDDDAALAAGAAQELELELRSYVIASERFGFQLPDCVEAVLIDLPDVIEFLKGQSRPEVKGGRAPDTRRRICAAVCKEVWRRHHDGLQPTSRRLWRACDDYWLACGQLTSDKGELRTWEWFCRWAAQQNDEEWNEDFERQIQRLTTE
jgi:hypothetical protein